MGDEHDRIAALEQRVAELEARLELAERVAQQAFGEAVVAGQLAPTALTLLKVAGPINAPVLYEALDRLMLRFEESEGSYPGSQEAMAYARSRLGATLRGFGPPPERGR